jgi:hypothetical protein
MASQSDILNYLKLSISVEKEPSEDVRELLSDTVLGTPGKFRYRHTSFHSKLPFLGQIYFLVLKKSGRLLGCIAFSRRETSGPQGTLPAWYIRYFSIRTTLQVKSQKLKRKEKRQKKKSRGDNLLKQTLQQFFDDPVRLDEVLGNHSGGQPVYAYVEKENLRSWNFTEIIGFETVGCIHTTLFSRFRPKMDPHVQQLSEKDKKGVLTRLREFYKDHALYTQQNLFYGGHYLVWKENGETVAGCQANPEAWKLLDDPGLLNKLFFKVLLRLPILSRRFDPGFLKFVAIEGIWYKDGFEKRLLKLFESACAHHGLYLAMIWLDSRSPVFQTIHRIGRLGILDKVINPAIGDIRIKFNHCTEEEKQYYYDHPAYISCFDMT